MVGKEVEVARGRVGTLRSPSFETQVEDVDVEREEEDDAGDGEGGDAENANCGSEAVVEEIIGAAGGREGSRRKRGVGGGRGVD